jgi:tight adherence protein B
MTLLIIAFLSMMLLTFGILLLAMRPSSEQKALEKRITHIKTAPGQASSNSGGLLLATPDAGAFFWIERLIANFSISGTLQTLIVQADANITVGKVLFISGAIGAGFFTCAFLYKGMILPALIAGVQACFYPVLFLRFKRDRKVKAFNAGLADSIDMMSRSLRAGHSVVAAIGIVAEQAVEPVRSEFNEVFKKQNYGLPLREALMQLLDRVPSQDLRVLVTGMLVQKETGGNLAEILDRISHVIRERLRIKGEIRTHTAQGRLTGWILCLLPLVMLLMLNFINPGYSSILFDDPRGRKLLYTGVGLLVAGGLSIRTIINSIEV